MPPPRSKIAQAASFLTPHVWWVSLVLGLLLMWVATDRRVARVESITNRSAWSVDAPQEDAESLSGYANGQRRLIVPGHHNPTFWWIMEAQQSVEQGSLRLRHIEYDAQPEGRQINRTSPYRWWLIAVGWLVGTVSGEPIGRAIEHGALFADPILHVLLLIVGTIFCARFFGTFAAMGFVVAGVSIFPLAGNFQPGAPDPRSLAWVLALGSLLPLLASIGNSTDGGKRMHFVASGIFGGLALWNDSESQAPVLLALFLGAVGYELIRSRNAGDRPRESSDWRTWAVVGAMTTLGASVFEFAPGHFSWSLDSVHPFHAVVWWGMGEVLRAVERWSHDGRGAFDQGTVILSALGMAAILVWPVAGSLSDSGGLLASDFNARQLANHPDGVTAPKLGVWLRRDGGPGAKFATLFPCILLVVIATRLFVRKTGPNERGRLMFLLVGIVFVAALGWVQLRWWNLFDVWILAIVPVLLVGLERLPVIAQIKMLSTILVVVPGFLVGFPSHVRVDREGEVSPPEEQELIARDFSWWLVKRAGSDRVVLFSTPIFSSAAAFYGGFDVVVSSDNTNADSFLTAVRIVSADTVQEVSILMDSHEVTHLALPLWDPSLEQLVRIGLNVPPGQPLPSYAFVSHLLDWDTPPWMSPKNYVIPRDTGHVGFDLRCFARQGEESDELSLSRLADLFLERGMMTEARSVREALEAYPRSVAALGAIANVDLAMRSKGLPGDELEESLDTLIPYMSRRSARNLPVDRRISLAGLFTQTLHVDLARDQIESCLEVLDAETLRVLTTASVVRLVVLSRTFGIPFPEPELESLAMDLIPPKVRERLPIP